MLSIENYPLSVVTRSYFTAELRSLVAKVLGSQNVTVKSRISGELSALSLRSHLNVSVPQPTSETPAAVKTAEDGSVEFQTPV